MKADSPESFPPAETLQDRLFALERTISSLRRQLQQECDPQAPDEAELDKRIRSEAQTLEDFQKKISEAKSLSKKRKREIDEWKLWFNSLEKADRTDEIRQLQSEVEWRAADIGRQEEAISRLIQEQLVAEGRLEQLRLQLAARREGFHLRPPEEDPRLQTALEAKAELEQQLGRLQ